MENNNTNFTATRNACKLCTPLGAALAFEGIENSVPLLHGSQGCSTYIRRYMISHFKEPIDIASTNFSEETAVFGGGQNLKIALDNIIAQYNPEMIGIATTCLSETIGDDVPMYLNEYKKSKKGKGLPGIVHVSTPSYRGTHADGFHNAIRSTVDTLLPSLENIKCVRKNEIPQEKMVNIFPGMVSPEDLRHIKDMVSAYGLKCIMLPDYSERLDGTLWSEFEKIPRGGTKLADIKMMPYAAGSIEFGKVLGLQESAGKLLNERFGVTLHSPGLPIGVQESDNFFSALEEISGIETPDFIKKERGRLLDSYVDGHKYVSKAKAVVYGEEDLVAGIVTFLSEIGIIPVICASGGKSGQLEKVLKEACPDLDLSETMIMPGADFIDIEEMSKKVSPDIIIGHSKGYSVARKLGIPIVRIGFPIHDRFGGARIQHLGYRGTQQLYDRIVNSIMEKRQESSEVGYSYI
ncbi:MAG: nitrogenase component 1 [Desulfobacteraceae bacterium]|jgi:nitrogenase molybdenum-iron protein NifN